jgi:hypothetical protein
MHMITKRAGQIATWSLMLWTASAAVHLYAENAWIPIGPEGGRVRSIVQHPTQDNVLYLSAGESRSGVYKSTNRGNTWIKLAAMRRDIFDLAVNPGNTEIMYACAYDEFFRSTNGGADWSSIRMDNQGISDLSADVNNTAVLHACGFQYSGGAKQNLMAYFRSTDSGLSWSVKSPTEILSYGQAVCVDPANPDHVFIGGYSYDKSSAPLLFRTTDGGTTWQDVTGSILGSVVDVQMEAGGQKRIFVAAGGGVFRSTDLGATWIRNSGYVSGNALALDPKDANTLYLGGNNQAFRSTDGGINWQNVSTGFADGGLANAVLADRSSADVYMGSEAGFFKSTDSGQTWSASDAGILSATVTAVACRPSNQNELYAARQNLFLYRTQNALGKASDGQAVSWEKIYRIPNCDSYSIKTVLFDPVEANTLYLYKEFG